MTGASQKLAFIQVRTVLHKTIVLRVAVPKKATDMSRHNNVFHYTFGTDMIVLSQQRPSEDNVG